MTFIEKLAAIAPKADSELVAKCVVSFAGTAADLRVTNVELAAALSLMQERLFKEHGIVVLPEAVIDAMSEE